MNTTHEVERAAQEAERLNISFNEVSRRRNAVAPRKENDA